MDISFWSGSTLTWAENLEHARWARRHGLRGFWYADHWMPDTGSTEVDEGQTRDCWTVLTAVGALVPDLELVSHVSPTTFHHPLLLLKRAIEADHVSGGRVVLGLGAGWQLNEHAAYGIELFAPRERVDRFAEAIEIIHRLRTEERLDFAGTHFRLREAPMSPKPVGPLPILVGTRGPRMLRLTARWADRWNTWGDPETASSAMAALDAACEREGRDPSTIRRSVQVRLLLTDDASAAAAHRQRWGFRGIAGGAAEIVDTLGRYVAAGFDEFGLHDGPFGDDRARRMDALDRFAAEVLRPFGHP